MRYPVLLSFIIVLIAAGSYSFSLPEESPQGIAMQYYDAANDSLLANLKLFQKKIKAHAPGALLKTAFLNARTVFKRSEFLSAYIDAYQFRLINGPDLLRIEEDAPSDTLQPHGFQVIEDILYADGNIDYSSLDEETKDLIARIHSLRNNPDRIYQLSDVAVWDAMRYGVYRIISLGITGFDVPHSLHALPETESALYSLQQLSALYHAALDNKKPGLYEKGDKLFVRALVYLHAHKDFNSFDRLVFIRDYLNPISSWMTACAHATGWIKNNERVPVNPYADNLFAADLPDMRFFSPNDRYSITRERIELGKRLFFDEHLSGSGKRSCGSCHQPAKGFADGLSKPVSIDGSHTLLRNSPGLWNTVFQTRQFFDSRTDKLENQLSDVVHNSEEMNGSLKKAIPLLQEDKIYNEMFRKAYAGDNEPVTEYTIANAISTYVRSLVSYNSRFDQYMRHEAETLTAAEKNGFNLFMGKAKCGTCHYAPFFSGLVPPRYDESESEILAVPATAAKPSALDTDPGKYRFTKVGIHKYAFKTPTVRNIALTAPYMHNGVYRTLEEVLEFYNKGGGAGFGIKLSSQTLPPEPLHLTKKEMGDIIAFMKTLTDTSGTGLRAIVREEKLN